MPKNKSLKRSDVNIKYPIIKYFTKDPVLMIKVSQNAPSILKYLFDLQNFIEWYVFKARTKGKIDDIQNYKDIHKGERCFIIGNGPSVNKTDFSLIKNEINFGTNRLYESMKKLGINCTYHVTSNRYIVSTYYDDLCNIDVPIFLGQHGAEAYGQKLFEGKKEFKRKPIPFRYKRRLMWQGEEMSTDLAKTGSSDSGTVITECLHIAYYMGFKKVYLLGCDCDFSEQYHFYTDMSNPSASWEDGSIEIPLWFESYKMCKKAYEADGREIINATVGGKLEVFKRQSLEEIMKNDK